ncbi:MAG: PKD domain-containing protein, partial [Bacteroidota bacterium]
NNIVSFCMGDSAMLDAGNPGNTYLWTPGGETTQTITVSSAGQYSVAVTNSNGCSGIVNTTVNVNPLPFPGFSANGGCAGQPVNFTDTTNVSVGAISQWSWDFGDPVHSYASSGAFLVTLTVTSDSGCTATFSQSINTATLPTANFTTGGSCLGMPIQFTDGSAGGTITQWNWNFGDGTTSLLQNPTHNFSSAGTYSVILTAITSNGCTDSKTKQVVIHNLPNANFSSNIVCQGFTTLFTDLSSDSTSGINSWSWNFGDGNSSLQSNPSHVYSQSGNFTTQLITTSSNGCADTIAHNVIVNSLPIANAGPDQALCQGQPVTLTASGGIVYLWSSGQSTASITVNPSATTTYIVTVTNNNGCKNTDAVTVGVGSVPIVILSDVFICTGNSAILNAGNPGSSYIWSTGETIQAISVSSAGNYSVMVTNTAGCTGVAQANVTVGGSGLTDNLNDVSLCPGQSATFNAGNPGNSFLWSTGSTSQSITAAATGIYTVTITDTSGCAASFAAALIINPFPVAGFSSSVSCLNDQTTFTNTSSISSGNIAANFWNFGDGSTSQLLNPIHNYTITGSFNVHLTVTSDMGCIDSITMPAHVYPVPASAFTAPDECLYISVSFADNSSVLNDSINSWSWNFGDNGSAGSQNVAHQYSNPGNYLVLLVVTTVNGCSDSATHTVIVHPVPDADFSAAPVCEDAPMIFSDSTIISSGTIASWNWKFGDNTTGIIQNPSHNYPAYGIYNASLIVTSNYGCTDTAIHNVTLLFYPS